jgi:oxygen-independent coproporphyrinogen-3 oxidase
MTAKEQDLIIDTRLIRKYDKLGPRYTSYPTADRFVEAYDARTHEGWLAKRSIGGVTLPLSLYVHLPFCDTVCFYCACNKVVTKDHSRSAKYLRYLGKELDMTSRLIEGTRRIEQLHWGGGTPTFLSDDEMTELIGMIGEHFEFSPQGEYSIEIDPRSVDAARFAVLAKLGFNRVSLGVQDFNPEVQKAVNRIQPEEQTFEAVAAARANNMKSVSIDLIYGLPKQNVITFNQTMDRVIELSPDRIALYNYAHLPGMFKPQRRIAEAELPSPEAKLQILTLAIHRLTEAGYVYIGMDHFAKPEDELNLARKQGRLHRNFQGYSTHRECDLLAFGISAISKIGPVYAQNVRTLDEYYHRLDHDELPVLRGIELTPDDVVRRAVIQALMCHFEVSLESINIAYLIDFNRYFAEELEALAMFAEDGMVTIDDQWISVTPRGRLLVRAIGMVFDRYLRQGEERARFSKVI